MKVSKDIFMLWILLVTSLAFSVFTGCDSGEKTIDQVIGNEAVKQYQETKEDIDDVVDRQNERLDSVNNDDSDDEILDEISEEASEE